MTVVIFTVQIIFADLLCKSWYAIRSGAPPESLCFHKHGIKGCPMTLTADSANKASAHVCRHVLLKKQADIDVAYIQTAYSYIVGYVG